MLSIASLMLDMSSLFSARFSSMFCTKVFLSNVRAANLAYVCCRSANLKLWLKVMIVMMLMLSMLMRSDAVAVAHDYDVDVDGHLTL